MSKRARPEKKKDSKNPNPNKKARRNSQPTSSASSTISTPYSRHHGQQFPEMGTAPLDKEPFDYIATRPTDEEMATWARPVVPKEYLQSIMKNRKIVFQNILCATSYVRPDEYRGRSSIHWSGLGQVPVVRVYGVTAEGYSVCANVANFSPYFFIHVPKDIEEDIDLWTSEKCEALANELDQLVAKASNNKRGQNSLHDSTSNEAAQPNFDPADFWHIGGDNDTKEDDSSMMVTPPTNNGTSTFYSSFSDNAMDPFAAERLQEQRKHYHNSLKKSTSLLAAHSNDGLVPFDKVLSNRASSHLSASGGSRSGHGSTYSSKKAYTRRFIVSLELVHYEVGKDYVDKLTPFLRVNMRTPNMVTTLRNLIGHKDSVGLTTSMGFIHGPTYESGVKYESRFTIDHEIIGSGWVAVTGPFMRLRPDDQHDTTCQIELDIDTNEIRGIGVEANPELYMTKSQFRVHSRDIEVQSYTGDFPDPNRDPVIIIHSKVAPADALDKPIANVTFCLGSLPEMNVRNLNERYICFETERELLAAYGAFTRLVDPDIETGYNTKNFDARYLFDRCTKLGVQDYLFSSRLINKAIEKKSKFRESRGMGNRESWLCPSEGRVEIDVLQFMTDNHKLSSYSLNAVSAHFLNDQKDDVNHKTIPILFKGSREDRLRLARYCRKDTDLPLRLMTKLRILPFLFEMSRAQGVQLADQQDGMATLKVFTLILTEARRSHMILPYVPDQAKEWYQGANVFEPARGFYQKYVVILDFFSLYPSEAIAHNLCFSTHVPNSQIDAVAAKLGGRDKLETCPDGFTYVRSSIKKGIIPKVQSRLITLRDAAKAVVKSATDPDVKQAYSSREVALKITNNSVYGWTGVPNNGQYNQHVSRSITAYGRQQILKTRDVIETEFTKARGYPGDAKVLYGDTDSVMVDFGLDITSWEDQDDVDYCLRTAKELAQKAADLCTSHFAPPNKLQVEGVMAPFLLVSKKRYGALLWNNPYQHSGAKIKGLECVRRDNCRHASRTQRKCLDLLFESLDPDKSIEYARQQIVKLRKNQVDFYDLIITAGLSKTSEEYATPQAHARVADLIKKRSPGSEPHIGDRVPYVIVRGDKDSKRFERAEDPSYAIDNDMNIDTDYYVETQMMGPLQRIFEPIFGEEETKRRLTTGETNVRITRIDNRKSGLTLYFERNETCIHCGTQIPIGSKMRGVCASCEPYRMDEFLSAQKDYRQAQLEQARVWTHCQSCQGSNMREIVCDATDCPLFYKRKTVLKDLDRLQKQVSLLTLNDW